MEIRQKTTGRLSEFYNEQDGQKIGEMAYHMDNDGHMVITHTEVFDKEKGKGLAKELVRTGVEFARANNYQIIPLCPYAKHVIERNTEYQDVLEG